MKKSTRKVLLSAATLAAITGMAHDAYAAKENLNMKAKIIQAIVINATKTLNFGSITETGTGTVKVEFDNTVTPVGSVSVFGAAAQGGGFEVTAANNAALEFSLPATAVVKDGANSMNVKSFTITGAKATGGSKVAVTLVGTTKTGIGVGGTLYVAAGQATGTYTGTAVLTGGYQ